MEQFDSNRKILEQIYPLYTNHLRKNAKKSVNRDFRIQGAKDASEHSKKVSSARHKRTSFDSVR